MINNCGFQKGRLRGAPKELDAALERKCAV